MYPSPGAPSPSPSEGAIVAMDVIDQLRGAGGLLKTRQFNCVGLLAIQIILILVDFSSLLALHRRHKIILPFLKDS